VTINTIISLDMSSQLSRSKKKRKSPGGGKLTIPVYGKILPYPGPFLPRCDDLVEAVLHFKQHSKKTRGKHPWIYDALERCLEIPEYAAVITCWYRSFRVVRDNHEFMVLFAIIPLAAYALDASPVKLHEQFEREGRYEGRVTTADNPIITSTGTGEKNIWSVFLRDENKMKRFVYPGAPILKHITSFADPPQE
jgi:hypothetical protein